MTEAFLVDGVRTPIGRYGGALAGVRPDDLAAHVAARARRRLPSVDWAAVDDVVLGCANQAGEDNRNVARMALLLAGLPETVSGTTVNRLCGSGADAVAIAARAVRAGEADLVVAGGVESMSRAPFVMAKAQSAYDRRRPCTTPPWAGGSSTRRWSALYGTDSMGETAENVAAERDVSRADQDAFALRSQERAAKAVAAGRLAEEIVPVTVPARRGDPTRGRARTSTRGRPRLEALAALKPAFRAGGTRHGRQLRPASTTAPAALLVASEAAVERYGLVPLARVVGVGHGRRTAPGDGPRSGARHAASCSTGPGSTVGRHRRDRAERGVRRPGARGAARARPARRRRAREPATAARSPSATRSA